MSVKRILTITMMVVFTGSHLLMAQDEPAASSTHGASGVDASAIQGEYTGTLSVGDSSVKVASQIIALGEDRFRLVFYRKPLRSSYLLLLGLITFVILFSAIWVGLHLARELSIPILKLAAGTEAVANSKENSFRDS